eukprot:NODE_10691_length_498_cov_11.328000_g10040_i0.p1 GENE.NODE_10691_length_498_cov_11.328000_g10040_i0~~NODE_10691_length_498_cov_11.328000_g10040_i0.p1  ORF type:complete len:149 (+),score=26.65 NODE_10691_length_498_cov_11.328000_g10040_i0:56-448(+)
MQQRKVDKDLRRPMRDDGLPDVRGPGQLPETRLEINQGSSPNISTFIFTDESHTLGNSLRHVLMSNPKVLFCGYTVPHPLEDKMKMHLRVEEEFNAHEVIKDGLTEMSEIMQHTLTMFEQAWETYESKSA